MEHPNAITRLAEFVARHPRRESPPHHLDRAVDAFLDTLGCMVLGRDAPVTRVATKACKSWGHGPSRVPGTDILLPAPWAALVGGVAAHSYDLDDYTLIANDHPSAVLVPALLSQIATIENPVSGIELLDAYLIGLEVIFRAGEAVNMGHYNQGWHTTSTLGSLGATAAIARLNRLNTKQTACALSLTTSMGSGFVSQFGTMAKPMHAGISAKTGIVACGLAEAGITASESVLDGPVSLASIMAPENVTGFDKALEKLGTDWGLDKFGLGTKLYPSCGYTHRSIDGSLELRQRLDAPPVDQIVSVELSLPDFHLAILPYGVPNSSEEALFSAPWCAAVALATGDCISADFTPDGLKREEILALTARTTAKARRPKNPLINLDPKDPDVVTIKLADGRCESVEVDLWTGAPGSDLGSPRLLVKFYENCTMAKLGTEACDRLAAVCLDLPKSNSVSELLNAL